MYKIKKNVSFNDEKFMEGNTQELSGVPGYVIESWTKKGWIEKVE